MPPVPSVSFTISDGGLGRRSPSADGVAAIVFYDLTKPGTFGEFERVFSLAQAEALGITSAWQATSGSEQLTHYYIDEFYRLEPSGELWLGFFDPGGAETLQAYLERLAVAAGGQIRLLALAGTYAATLDTALQAFFTAQLVRQQPVDTILVEGPITRSNESRAIARVVAQDRGAMEELAGVATGAALPTWVQRGSGIGAALGLLARKPVNESLGWPRTSNLSSGTRWARIGFTDGTLLAAKTQAQLDTLHEGGEIFVRTFPNLTGAYFQGDPTRALATSDYSNIANNRAVHKALRIASATLTPDVNRPVLIDPVTGRLDPITVDYFESGLRRALTEGLVNTGEISGISEVFIDPAQNLLATDKLEVLIRLVPTGSASEIAVTLGLSNPANA